MARRRTQIAAAAPQELDGVLVRLAVAPGHWAEDIPPVPAGCMVTVSFGSDSPADEHREALELLGYTVVGTVADNGSGGGHADFLLTAAVIERHPTYWRSLADRGTHAYHLALGPAARAVAAVVAAHAPVLARPLRG